MQTKAYLSISALTVLVAGVSFYAGQQYEQSKQAAVLAQDIEDFGNLFSIATGKDVKKTKTDDDFLSLNSTNTEPPKPVQKVNELYADCVKPELPTFEYDSHMMQMFEKIYIDTAYNSVLDNKDCSCAGKTPTIEAAEAKFLFYGGEALTDPVKSNLVWNELERFSNGKQKRIAKICGGNF